MACAANSFPPPGTELRRSWWEWGEMWEREVEKAFKSFWAVSFPGRIYVQYLKGMRKQEIGLGIEHGVRKILLAAFPLPAPS